MTDDRFVRLIEQKTWHLVASVVGENSVTTRSLAHGSPVLRMACGKEWSQAHVCDWPSAGVRPVRVCRVCTEQRGGL